MKMNIAKVGTLIALTGILITLIFVIFTYLWSGEFHARTLLFGAVVMGMVFLVFRLAASMKK